MRHKVAFFVGWGFLLWLVATIFFRLLGQFLLSAEAPVIVALTFLVTVPLIAAVTYRVYDQRGVEPSERLTAAVCIALPGMLLDVLSFSFFAAAFPNLSEISAGALFGAWVLWAYGLILISGLFPRQYPRAA